MKKSELYRYAQGAVLECDQLTVQTRLEILRELMSKEDIALFTESKETEYQAEVKK